MAKPPPYKALDVANYILAMGDVITNLKLQKLLYYAQAWHLVKKGKELFEDDIEAWQYGPVVPAVYAEYKKYGCSPINAEISQEFDVLDKETQEYMDEFLRKYINYSAATLVSMIHGEDPWINVYCKNNSKEKSVILPKSMFEYYSKSKKLFNRIIIGDIISPVWEIDEEEECVNP